MTVTRLQNVIRLYVNVHHDTKYSILQFAAAFGIVSYCIFFFL